METTIFTIGHGAGSFETTLETLSRHGVATLIDVRSQPFSRHAPDFTRSRLETSCAAAGLGYRWMGDVLGGRPTDPALRRSDGGPDPQAMRSDLRFRSGLETVTAMAEGGSVALLCAEASPDRCHRATLLAPELIALGHRVLHLQPDGSATPHQEPLGLA
jgi:uncharacterized protein (DUF488 family)